jgi:predicted RNA-binding protein YlxR (DUF448 family)
MFYNLDYVLKDEGRAVLLCTSKDVFIDAAKHQKFKRLSEKIVFQGAEAHFVLVFGKG